MKTGFYTLYSIVTSLLWQAALVAIVLWGLPRMGINIPLWGLIIMMVALGIYDYISYRLGLSALLKKPVVIPKTLIGSRGKTTTPLTPRGYVKIGSELWKASSKGSNIGEGEEIEVVGVNRITLLVVPLASHSNERLP